MGVPRLVAILGSGETSPTMVKTHRALLERVGPPPVPAVLLDTPFGFQENAGEISARAVQYFRESVGAEIEVASLRGADDDTLATETALARLAAARYVFAGPGSPTYALRHWAGTPVPHLLAGKVERGGCVTFASAAALTLGAVAVPVYEIYKVGELPRWVDALDLLSAAGLMVAVIPHYDNAEGGTHDTRYCYLGERRLAQLEAELPAEAFVLGVDEHTGCLLDLDAGTASVVGHGAVTVRRAGVSTPFPSGSTVTLDELRATAFDRGAAPSGEARPAQGAPAGGEGEAHAPATQLADEVARLESVFEEALAAGDAQATVAAVLDLEQAMHDWSRDTLQSDQMDRARATLRSMIARLGDAVARGLQDPAVVVGPFVDAVIDARQRARANGDWATADALREHLDSAGVEVRDTPDGVEWGLRNA